MFCGRVCCAALHSTLPAVAALESRFTSLAHCQKMIRCSAIASTSRFFTSNNIAGPNIRKRSASAKTKLDEKRKQLGDRIATIPNALCFCRIGLTPFIGYLVVNESFTVALATFAVTGITDWLDGYIARNVRNQKSFLGSVIDPMADKMLITTLFITLTYVRLIPLSLTALVILRDVSLIIGGAVIRYRTLEKPVTLRRYFNLSMSPIQVTPTIVSKVNTTLQMFVIAGSLAAPVFGFTGHPLLTYLYFATAATTIYSGLQYMRLTSIKPVKKN